MKIRNILHKGLRKLYLEGDPKGLPVSAISKLSNMLAFLQDMQDLKELEALPLWKVHRLKGHRKGTWTLNVTKNWRLTFCYDTEENEIYNLNFEDYH